jgi:hypothetical protein
LEEKVNWVVSKSVAIDDTIFVSAGLTGPFVIVDRPELSTAVIVYPPQTYLPIAAAVTLSCAKVV